MTIFKDIVLIIIVDRQKQRVAMCPLDYLVHFVAPADMKEILHSERGPC